MDKWDAKVIKIKNNVESELSKLFSDGWELVWKSWKTYYFKRLKKEKKQ